MPEKSLGPFRARQHEHLTPSGRVLASYMHRAWTCLFPFVSLRRYAKVRAERYRLLDELLWLACELNMLERKVRAMRDPKADIVPSPGSDAALDCGCTCPVIDNGHGRGYRGGAKDPETGETLFVMSAGCLLHGTDAFDDSGRSS